MKLNGDVKSNGGRVREKERVRINDENMRTHGRLSKVVSSIPKPRLGKGEAEKERKEKGRAGKGESNGEMRKRLERARIVAGNRKIEGALKDIYRGKARLAEHGVKKKDCRDQWSGRTSIYDTTSTNVAKPGTSTVRRDTGVPTTAAVVACGGCGNRTYSGADGNKVFQGCRGDM